MNKRKGLVGAVFAAVCSILPLSAEAAWQPDLLIGLQSGQSAATLSSNIPIVVRSVTNGKILWKADAGKNFSVTCKNGAAAVNGKTFSNTGKDGIEFCVEDVRKLSEQITYINGRAYRGAVRILPSGNGFSIISHVTTEEYLRGVVPEEMPPEWNSEAVKAQAVAARTFALNNRKRHSSEGYDLCATTHCQQYSGIDKEKNGSDAAIRATAGEVVTYQGKLIDALFHTDSGGMTENSENVWGSRVPYLRAASEVHTRTYPWEKNMTAENLVQLLDRHGKTVGSLKKVELEPYVPGKNGKERTVSGRVRQVRFMGTKGSAVVSGNDLRSWAGLNSTLFDMSLRNNVIFISGFGWGHGLGLSQWGAKAFADEKGYKYDEILSHYYAGTVVKKLYGNE